MRRIAGQPFRWSRESEHRPAEREFSGGKSLSRDAAAGMRTESFGKREISGKGCAATNVAATHLAATDFIIILPRLL
jgi:hypothetical protein